MSSGPVGADARDYEYGCDVVRVAGSRYLNGWLVTRIQVFTTTEQVTVRLPAPAGDIPVVAGGCLVLEPNGALREPVAFAGLGIDETFLALIEYWYPPQATGIAPSPA